MWYVQNGDIAVPSISLDSWPRPEEEYVCDSIILPGVRVSSPRSHWKIYPFPPFICFVFLSNMSRPLNDETDFFLYLSHWIPVSLAQVPAHLSAPCLVLGDPSWRAACALLTNKTWKKTKAPVSTVPYSTFPVLFGFFLTPCLTASALAAAWQCSAGAPPPWHLPSPPA